MDKERAEIYADDASKKPDPVRMLMVVLQTTDLDCVALYLSKYLGGLLISHKTDVGKGRKTLERLCYCLFPPGAHSSVLGGTLSTFQHRTPFYNTFTEFQSSCDDGLHGRVP